MLIVDSCDVRCVVFLACCCKLFVVRGSLFVVRCLRLISGWSVLDASCW